MSHASAPDKHYVVTAELIGRYADLTLYVAVAGSERDPENVARFAAEDQLDALTAYLPEAKFTVTNVRQVA